MPKYRVIQEQKIYRSIEVVAPTKRTAEKYADGADGDEFESDGYGDWYTCPEKTEEVKK